MRIFAASIGAVVLAAPGASLAQVTQSYSYDINGRLTEVTTAGPGGTHTAAYVYDDADNRISRSQTGTATWAALSRLPVGEDLQPHQALVSPNSRFSLAVRASGALELWFDQSFVRANPADGAVRPIFAVNDAGNVRFRGSGPDADRLADAYLALGDDGDLSLVDGADSTLLWAPADTRDMESAR